MSYDFQWLNPVTHTVQRFLSIFTVHLRIGTPHQVLNGTFGMTSASVFLDNLACDGGEKTLLDCPRGSRLGLISESCACTTFSDCVEDLGVICPGLLNNL